MFLKYTRKVILFENPNIPASLSNTHIYDIRKQTYNEYTCSKSKIFMLR